MFASSMQSQQALANERRGLQEAMAGYERRLVDAEEQREREVAALHARASQAMRELQAGHEQEIQVLWQDLETEKEQVRLERAKSFGLQATIDQLRAERLQRREEHGGEEASRELDAARTEARKWRLEVDVLTTRLEARENLFQADKQRRVAEEQDRDAQLVEAQDAWKERLAELEAQLEKAWADQARLQAELSDRQGGQVHMGSGGGGGSTALVVPSTFPDSTPAFGRGDPQLTELALAPSVDPWGQSANTGPPDGGMAFGAGGGGGGGWLIDGMGSGDGAFGEDHGGGWPGMPGTSKSASKEGKRRSKSGSRKKDAYRGDAAGGSGALQPASAPGLGPTFSFGGKGGCGAFDGPMPVNDPAQVAELVNMGFPEERVQEVLAQVHGDVDQAISQLLGGA